MITGPFSERKDDLLEQYFLPKKGVEMMQRSNHHAYRVLPLVALFLLSFFTPNAHADPKVALSTGATVYVSIYSHLYAGPKAITYNLAAMLSIRNTDPKFSITITFADYYNSEGKLVERYLKEPIKLQPLATKHFYIHEYDTSGGSGANFIVKWRSKEMVNKPIIEGVMTGLRSGQGVSFRCPGQEITEHKD